MTTKIQKWGNSYGIRIPKEIMESLNLEDRTEVEFIEKNNTLIIKPKSIFKKKKYNLQELIDGTDFKNGPREIDWGPDVGKEILDEWQN